MPHSGCRCPDSAPHRSHSSNSLPSCEKYSSEGCCFSCCSSSSSIDLRFLLVVVVVDVVVVVVVLLFSTTIFLLILTKQPSNIPTQKVGLGRYALPLVSHSEARKDCLFFSFPSSSTIDNVATVPNNAYSSPFLLPRHVLHDPQYPMSHLHYCLNRPPQALYTTPKTHFEL